MELICFCRAAQKELKNFLSSVELMRFLALKQQT